MDELRERGVWLLFKTLLCVVPASGILAGASAASGFTFAASILGWIFAISGAAVVCLTIWVLAD